MEKAEKKKRDTVVPSSEKEKSSQKKSFQPSYIQEGSYINETTNEEVKTYETININYYKKLLVHNNKLYVISDNMKDSSKLLKYNITNTSSQYDTVLDSVEDLPDVISVRDIELNPITNKIYILSGLVSSELRQYDSDFKQIKANGCGSDFIKIPNDLGLIEQFTIDYNIISSYLLISIIQCLRILILSLHSLFSTANIINFRFFIESAASTSTKSTLLLLRYLDVAFFHGFGCSITPSFFKKKEEQTFDCITK